MGRVGSEQELTDALGQSGARHVRLGRAGLDGPHEMLDEGVLLGDRAGDQQDSVPEAADEAVARLHGYVCAGCIHRRPPSATGTRGQDQDCRNGRGANTDRRDQRGGSQLGWSRRHAFPRATSCSGLTGLAVCAMSAASSGWRRLRWIRRMEQGSLSPSSRISLARTATAPRHVRPSTRPSGCIARQVSRAGSQAASCHSSSGSA